MPTDISHLPPAPGWVIPQDREDPRTAVAEWLGHIAAGRIGGNPPPPPHILARRLATEAQFAAYRRERRA
jgi:hypothetical protein